MLKKTYISIDISITVDYAKEIRINPYPANVENMVSS
jgi:hypothetical protein